MKRRAVIIIGLISFYLTCCCQSSSNLNLIGEWSINDTVYSHKLFNVILKFGNDSVMSCSINGELKYTYNYKTLSTKDSNFIYLKRPEENYEQSYKHILRIKADTLEIIPFYFIILPEYDLKTLDGIYFIRTTVK
jgi:hypothetical protein